MGHVLRPDTEDAERDPDTLSWGPRRGLFLIALESETSIPPTSIELESNGRSLSAFVEGSFEDALTEWPSLAVARSKMCGWSAQTRGDRISAHQHHRRLPLDVNPSACEASCGD